MRNPIPKIAIIGGGPGGLMTAYSLQNCLSTPAEVSLYEASSRLGGKILTPSIGSVAIPYEAGAAEFYDYSQFRDDPLKELVLELGLPIRTMGGPAVLMGNQLISNIDDLTASFGHQCTEEYLRFDNAARNFMTPQEFYFSDLPEGGSKSKPKRTFVEFLNQNVRGDARRYIDAMIHSDLATEEDKTSIEYGLQNYLMNDPSYMDLYGIEGGNERLVRELAKRIDARVYLNQSIERIEYVSNRFRLYSSQCNELPPNDLSEISYDYVVIALPLNSVPTIRFLNAEIEKKIVEHYQQYDHPAHYLRMTLLFETPFWRNKINDSFWMLDQFGGCCLYDESSRIVDCSVGLLGWLLAGQNALTQSTNSDDELIQLALDSLPSQFSEARFQFIEGRVHRWTNAVNALPSGWIPLPADKRHRPAQVDAPNLLFVGDYLYDSTLNGVKDSADYVSAWIASDLS